MKDYLLVKNIANVINWGPELISIVGVVVASLEVRQVLDSCNSKYIQGHQPHKSTSTNIETGV